MGKENKYDSNYVLKDIFVMKYCPKIFKSHIESRGLSSFLYVIDGSYHYECSSGDVYVHSGETIYLPKGGCYTYNVTCENANCIQVEFNLEKQGEDVVFSESPVVICGNSLEIKRLFEEIFYSYSKDEFAAYASIYKLLSIAHSAGKSVLADNDFKRIAPAMQYIEMHIQEKIYVNHLAELCNLSQSHFRRLFKKCLGISPVKYKNRILMRTACSMLINDGMNVSETAEALNFSDIYTFSQLFKKETGMSPKKYKSSV